MESQDPTAIVQHFEYNRRVKPIEEERSNAVIEAHRANQKARMA